MKRKRHITDHKCDKWLKIIQNKRVLMLTFFPTDQVNIRYNRNINDDDEGSLIQNKFQQSNFSIKVMAFVPTS